MYVSGQGVMLFYNPIDTKFDIFNGGYYIFFNKFPYMSVTVHSITWLSLFSM